MITSVDDAKRFLRNHQPLLPDEIEWPQDLLDDVIQCLKVLDAEPALDRDTMLLLINCVSSNMYSHRHYLAGILASSDMRLIEKELSAILRSDHYQRIIGVLDAISQSKT